MKKTIQINIGGRHFYMDEDAFQKLNHYLESLKSHFEPEGETGREIMEDIEQRIAELLENKITDTNQAISLENVNETIGILGKVEDFVYAGTTTQARTNEPNGRRENRRFYRDADGNYIAGVAAGMGAYFDIDPLWIRLSFVALLFLNGLGILIYGILWIVVPKATTTAEKLQMRGIPVTLTTIKASVDAEYEKVKEGLNNLGKSSAVHKTQNIFENLIRAMGLFLLAIFKFVIGAVGVIFLIIGSICLAAMIMVLLGFSHTFGHFNIWNGVAFPQLSHLFVSSGHYYLIVIALIILVLIPITALIYGGIKILFNIRTKHTVLRAFLLTAWILALVLFITLIILNGSNYAVETSDKQSARIENQGYPRLYIEVRDNTENKKITQYSVFDHRFNYSEWDKSLYTEMQISLLPTEDKDMSISVEKHANNVGMKHAKNFLERINYHWEQKDSMIYINKYLSTNDENFWMFPRVNLFLRIPENQVVILSKNMCGLKHFEQQYQYCNDSALVGKPSIMTADGLMLQEKQKAKSIRNK